MNGHGQAHGNVQFQEILAAPRDPHVCAGPGTADAPCGGGESDGELISRIGKITRVLHESLRELGYDKKLASAASSMPEARDRLSYVAGLTQAAAQRALNAIETAKPIQDKLASDANLLAQRWNTLFADPPGVEDFKTLVAHTREFLASVPAHAYATDVQLTEIMLAQEFEDLAGQVIRKIIDIVHQLEAQLLELLLETMPQERRPDPPGVLAGPVISGVGHSEVVSSQAQVDNLLASLGF